MSDDEKGKVTIECASNGPLLVKNLRSLRNSKGETLSTEEFMALCRCGASATKPFCDGTHSKIKFRDQKRTDGLLDKRDSYVGQQITIHDNRGICSHASFCADELETVFNADREPWVNPEASPAQAIIDVINKCPSGALSYSIDGLEYRDQERAHGITVSMNGPYFITGGIELQGATWGECASQEHYALCRCGGSTNLPVCDVSLRSNDFRDDDN